MGKETGIQWTDHTYNPWWGCTKVSPGCDHCYAETLSTRWGQHIWGPDAERRFFGDKHWSEPLKWNGDAEQAGIRRRVFCGSMCDWAEGRPDQAAARDRLFELIEATPHLDWQLLTKRPGAIRHLVPPHWIAYPPANVWYGTSVENQEQADRRIPQLLQVPAAIRFLSCEPLLGPISFRPKAASTLDMLRLMDSGDASRPAMLDGIQWIITGGESGHGARPMHPDWARGIREQCQAAGVAFFHKQHGEYRHGLYDPDTGRTSTAPIFQFPDGTVMTKVGKKVAGRMLDGQEWSQFPESAVEAH